MKFVKRSFTVVIAVVLVGSFGQTANATPPSPAPPEVAEHAVESELGEQTSGSPSGGTEELRGADEQAHSGASGAEDDAPASEPEDPSVDPTVDPSVGGVEDEVAEITSAPDSLEVTGTVRVFPAEPTQESLERRAKAEAKNKGKRSIKKKAPKAVPIEDQRFELNPEDLPDAPVAGDPFEDEESLDMVPGAVLLETAEGDTLPIDPATVSGDIVGGATFVGTVEMTPGAKVSVDEAIAATAVNALSESQVVEIAAETTLAAAETFAVLNAEILPPPTPRAASIPMTHSADVVFFTNATTSQIAAVQELMTLTSDYWKRESAGLVAGIKVNAIKQEKVGGLNVCNEGVAWARARELFNAQGSYFGGAKHLVVLIDQKCAQGTAGWGDTHSLHAGGEVWVNLSNRRKGTAVKEAVHTLQHEIGHNLGLGHSNVRLCAPAGVSDTALGYVTASSGICYDQEYGDMWGAMGFESDLRDSNSASLPVIQKIALGVPSTGLLVDAKQSNGVTQRFTINALSSNSGTRGIRVQQSAGSEPFFVEYRNGLGSDSSVNREWPEDRGVRIHKPRGRFSVEIRTPAEKALSKGQWLHPYGGRARVTVESTTSSQAVVRVDFYTTFTDVMSNDRFAGDIQWMHEQKISTGSMQADRSVVYGPKVAVSREAIAAFFFRGYAPATYKPGAKGKLPFTDIATSHKFYKEIYWMWERGITTGTKQANGTVKYLPGDSLSREAMAAFIYRVKGASYTPPAKSPFVDVSTTSQFYKHIAWLYAKGVSTGTVTSSGRVYEPKLNTTREATAPFMRRMSQI